MLSFIVKRGITEWIEVFLHILSSNSSYFFSNSSPYCFSMFQEIYKKGGRKFGFVNLEPLGCLPIMKEIKLQQGGTGECMEEATELAKLHNIALSKALQKLEIKLKGLKFSISNFQFLLSLRKEWTSLQNMVCCPHLHIMWFSLWFNCTSVLTHLLCWCC